MLLGCVAPAYPQSEKFRVRATGLRPDMTMPGQVVGRFQNAILRKHPIMPVINISRSRADAREEW